MLAASLAEIVACKDCEAGLAGSLVAPENETVVVSMESPVPKSPPCPLLPPPPHAAAKHTSNADAEPQIPRIALIFPPLSSRRAGQNRKRFAAGNPIDSMCEVNRPYWVRPRHCPPNWVLRGFARTRRAALWCALVRQRGTHGSGIGNRADHPCGARRGRP